MKAEAWIASHAVSRQIPPLASNAHKARVLSTPCLRAANDWRAELLAPLREDREEV